MASERVVASVFSDESVAERVIPLWPTTESLLTLASVAVRTRDRVALVAASVLTEASVVDRVTDSVRVAASVLTLESDVVRLSVSVRVAASVLTELSLAVLARVEERVTLSLLVDESLVVLINDCTDLDAVSVLTLLSEALRINVTPPPLAKRSQSSLKSLSWYV
jgi:hypothetical protein